MLMIKTLRNALLIVLCLIITLVFTSCKSHPSEVSSSTGMENNQEVVSNDNSADNTVTENEDGSTSSSKEESKPSAKPTGSKPSNTSNTSSKPSNEDNSKEDAGSKPSEDNNSSGNTSSQSKPVQTADPETGISWDGKSPIIYTYTDGTTGTERRDGAKYEYLPGKWRTVNFRKDSAGRLVGSTCPNCGKTVAELTGKLSTCTQFSSSRYCTGCGVYVKYRTCHSCTGTTAYCSHCGKISGNGTNGTCLRYSLVNSDVTCKSCGETIPKRTCHTCK